MRVQSRFLLLGSMLLFICSLSSASEIDIITSYKEHGIDPIEKQLDYKLTEKKYWKRYLADKDTSFGYLESYNTILACDKSQSNLLLYKNENGHFEQKKEYSAFTGKKQGDKQREGDLKTPVGVYNLVKKITKVDSFYGPMAFVTSYPNSYDHYKGKSGKGIWIHGLPINQERDSFTKGCIAINNQNIQCLDRNIDINTTLLLINESALQKESVSKDTYATLLSKLYSWRYAWIYNDITTYLSFYDPAFKRYDGVALPQFANYKTRIFNKNEKKRILFSKINIIPYPNTADIFEIRFNEKYNSESFAFEGEKVLIVKLTNNKLHIITEK